MERDDTVPEGLPDFFSRGVEALRRVLDNPVGSVLVDYEWLYGDLVAYDNLDSEAAHLGAVKRILAHNIRYGKGKGVPGILRQLMGEMLRCEQMEAGVNMLVRMLQSDPLAFEVYERACVAFLGNRQYRAAKAAFRGAGKIVYLTGDFRQDYDDLSMCMPDGTPEDSRDGGRPSEWEQRLRLVVRQFPRQLRPATHLQLARELVPDLDQVPVKEIPALG